MNKTIPTPLAILIILLVIAAIIGVTLWICPEKEIMPPQDETANWKTYTYKNTYLKYPQDWTVVFDSTVFGQPNGFSLHVMRTGDGGFEPDALYLSTYNDRSGMSVDYVPSVNRTFTEGNSLIQFSVNGTDIYASCTYHTKGLPTLDVCNKIVSTIRFVPDETADWKTYKSEKYGFEFKYPGIFDRFENCKLIENDNTIAVGSRFVILILDAKELNLLEYVAEVREESLREQLFPPPEEAWHQEDIYVGGIKGIKVVWFHGSRYSQMIYLSKDNRIFDIGFTAGTSCLDYYVEQGLLDEVHELDIFEQIPNTFKFLD